MISSERLQEILHRFNVPGPRYTSYPTVPAWSNEVGPNDYRTSLGRLGPKAPLSLYFHLPFCENLCHFCGCTQVITRDHSRSAGYTQLLLREMEAVAATLGQKRPRVVQIHFGGGTPNFFLPEEMQAIFQGIHRHFAVDPDAEIAIEMHPRTSTQAFCEVLPSLGFNRISLGVQDFDPIVQTRIRRFQTFEQTEEMITLLRNLRLNHFNFDLIYGLPAQTATGWARTIDQTLKLRPNRLAVYSYAHVPWVRPVQRAFSEEDLPTPEQKLQFFDLAYQKFTQAHYRLIGMDHFAEESDELATALASGSIHRNFMGYSTRAEAHQIGFGMSAISWVDGNYFQNRKELPLYSNTIEDGELSTFRGMLNDDDDRMRRDLINDLMCNGRIDPVALERKHGPQASALVRETAPQLTPFLEGGFLSANPDGSYHATTEGFLCLRNIAMLFDRHLEGVKRNATNPVFSKTI